MRGTLRLLFFGSLILLPVFVAAVITIIAIHLFHKDKELYVHDLSAQSVELVARNLAAQLKSLSLKAELHPRAAPPFMALNPVEPSRAPAKAGLFTIENVSDASGVRLRVITRTTTDGESRGIAMDVKPDALLDLRGYQGPTELMVVNDKGHLLVHPDTDRVQKRQDLGTLIRQLKLFSPQGARVGTREVASSLIAFARVGPRLAVLQTISTDKVHAAADPLVTSAIVASLIVVVVAVLVALLVGRLINRPLQVMAQQAEAIGRGEYGVSVQERSGGEVARLMESFNAMSLALKNRQEKVQQMQRQLLQAERLNTAGRMITAIVNEMSTPLETCFLLASKTAHALTDTTLRNQQKKIMEETNRAANILQNLSRLTSRDDSPPQVIEPDMVISEVLISSRPLFESRKLTLETNLGTPVGTIMASPEMLRNALLDILLFVANEAHADRPVLVSVSKKPQGVAIAISFEGNARSPKERELLMKPLSTDAEGEGSLELAVAAMVLEEQGGQLLFEGSGTQNSIVARLPDASAKLTLPSLTDTV